VIINIPKDITTDNLEGTLLAQNPILNLGKGDIKANVIYETKTHSELSSGGSSDQNAANAKESKTRVPNM